MPDPTVKVIQCQARVGAFHFTFRGQAWGVAVPVFGRNLRLARSVVGGVSLLPLLQLLLLPLSLGPFRITTASWAREIEKITVIVTAVCWTVAFHFNLIL